MQKKSGKNKSTFPKNAWFDDECKHLKRRVNSFAKEFDISDPHNWDDYCNLSSEYRKLIQRKKRQYKAANLETFENMLSNNPDKY